MEGALIYLGVAAHAQCLLAVGGKVLHTGGHALALEPVHIGGGQLPRQIGVFAEILEIAPAQRAALDIEPRAQQHTHVFCLALLPQGFAQGADQGPVKGGGEGRCRGETGGIDALVDAQVVPLAPLLAQAVRAVAHHHRGDAQPLYPLGVPEIPSGTEPRLLLQCQLPEDFF